MKYFIAIGAVIVLLGSTWNRYITQGGLLAKLDREPKKESGAVILYTLGKGYEFVDSREKSLEAYRRIVERYPNSPYAMEAHFGVALAHEKLNHYPEAIAAYQKFLEKYPNSKYAKSVQNNIEILKSR